MSEVVLCPKCNGNGKFYSPAQTTLEPINHCNVCNGKGAVRPLDFATLCDQKQRIADLEQREKEARKMAVQNGKALCKMRNKYNEAREAAVTMAKDVISLCDETVTSNEYTAEIASKTLRKFGG